MLETERCTIQPLQNKDYSEVKSLYVNEEVRKYLGGIPPERVFENSFNEIINLDEDSFYGVIREKKTNDFVGLVSLDLHHDGSYYEVSYQFLPNWWGKGYATETVQQVINYAFKERKLSKVIAETQTANTSSIRLLERLGMTFEKKLVRFGAEQAIYSIQATHYCSNN